jgi:hypothetical protein
MDGGVVPHKFHVNEGDMERGVKEGGTSTSNLSTICNSDGRSARNACVCRRVWEYREKEGGEGKKGRGREKEGEEKGYINPSF